MRPSPLQSRPVIRLAASLSILCAAAVQGAVTLPTIFGDHMVLQQGMDLPVWGKAEPGEKVTVTVGDRTASATADSDGKWRVSLPPFHETPGPLTMTVAGKNTLTFQDVVVGEVWFASGQSNMGFQLGKTDRAATDVAAANDPQIRFFHVGGGPDLWPSSKFECGKWELCTPEVAAKMSAVATFFGRELHAALKRPVGLIISAWGGTAIESWTPLAAIEGDPFFKGDVDRHAKMEADYPALLAEFPAKQQEWHDAQVAWLKGGGAAYNEALKAWNVAAAEAKAKGQPEPAKPTPPATAEPKQPPAPNGGVGSFGSLYNGVVAPVVPYAMKGVIWYQGESNAGNPGRYAKMFPALIKGWRAAWGEGDLPFLFVQLPGWAPGANWTAMREVQAQATALPNTAMVSTLDLGDRKDIHPTHKSTVGQRLALAARHLAYGQDTVCSGPVYEAMKVEGGTIRVTFKAEGGAPVIGASPWTPPGATPLPKDKLLGFAIANDKMQWFAADARIDGNSVIVSSKEVPNPVAVRYGWQNAPECNLFNKEGLSAPPFRTDDWKDVGESPAPTPAAP